MGLAEYAKERLGLPLVFPDRPTFKEFAVRVGRPARRGRSARRASSGVHPGYALGRDYAGMDDALLVAVTEKRTPADIDRLAEVPGAREADLREVAGRAAGRRACRARTSPVARGPRGAPPRAAAAPAGGRRARARPPLHRALDAQLRDRHRLLPARLLHDEAQPARQRARRSAARLPRPASAAGGGRRPGRARADVARCRRSSPRSPGSTPSRSSRRPARRAS